MLVENTLFGIVNKIDDAIKFLREHEPSEGYYVAFSGGKDSVVMLDLVRKSGVKHDVHLNLTSVDPPELIKFCRKHYPDIEYVKPKKSMYELIIHKGFPPTRVIRYCCSFLKEHGGTNRHVVTGVRREESRKRANYLPIEKDRRVKSKTHIRPILNWTELDVWEYIEKNKMPYCSIYDEDRGRIGCIMCPLSGKYEMLRDSTRWPVFYKVYMKAFGKAIERTKERGKKCAHQTAEEMMHWWIYGN